MRSGFHRQLLLLAALPATLVALALGFTAGWQNVAATRRSAQLTAHIEAAAMARGVVQLVNGRMAMPRQLMGGRGLSNARLLDTAGHVLSWRNRLDLPPGPHSGHSYLVERIGSWFINPSDLQASAPVPKAPALHVSVQLWSVPWNVQAGRGVLTAAGATAGALLLALLIATLLSTALSSRLRAMGRQLTRLTLGEYDKREPVNPRSELGRMATDLNRLADILRRRGGDAGRAVEPEEAPAISEPVRGRGKEFETLLHSLDHELRSPLNAISGYSQLLEREPLTASQKENLAVVNSAVKTITQLLEDMLQQSTGGRRTRVRAHKLQTFDLVTLIDEAISLAAPAAYAKGLDLVADCSGWRGLPVTGNPLHLRQILTNLLGNAVKYTPRGHVRLQLLVGSTKGDKLQVAFKVIDTGPGIAPKHRERVFQAHERLRATSGLPGKGLGLALSRTLAEELGGRILLEEAPGGGCCFTLEVALAHAESFVASPAPKPTPMLLFEHDPQIREALAHRLCAAGAELEFAPSRDELIRRLQQDSSGNLIGVLSLAPGEALPGRAELSRGLRVLACALDANAPAGLVTAPKCVGQQRLENLLGVHRAQQRKSAQSYLSPRLWRILCEDMPIDLDRLATALRNEDMEDARAAVHRICGTTSFVRMHESEKSARQLEKILKEPDISPARAWRQLRALSHTILGELRRIAPPVTQRSLASWRIMVVDDNRLNAELLARHLESHGAIVDQFAGAEEARSAAGPWDAILIDVQLADENGIKLGRELQRKFGQALIIAQSGDTQASTRALANRSGFHDYLTKPIELDALPERLRTLRHSRQEPQVQKQAL